MSMTLDQKRAQRAWNNVMVAAEHHVTSDYTNLAKAVPSLIMNSGLMQALAFLQAKIDRKQPEYEILLGQLCKWLGNVLGGTPVTENDRFPPEQIADFQIVMAALYSSSSSLYMRSTNETMALLRWVRQFADARKAMEKA